MRNTTGRRIAVCDIARSDQPIRNKITKAVRTVIDKGRYILGQELNVFEKEFAEYNGSSYAIGVASGTEALQLSLKALGIGQGDEVITAVNTAIPTAMAILAAGARPRFVDVRADTFNIDVALIEKAITRNTKAILPVHLYGKICDIKAVLKIAKKYNLFVVEDACQAHGASCGGMKAGSFGRLGAFSFYPTKNLGCYGDGGMIVTNNKSLAERLRLLRNYGQNTRYSCKIKGVNSRLDEIQAAILRVKLKLLDQLNECRIELAHVYARYLQEIVDVDLPSYGKDLQHVFHLYVIKCKDKDGLKRYLLKKGIETEVHYPIPLHLQGAFRELGYKRGDFPCAEGLAHKILTLPMHPALKTQEVRKVCNHIKDFYRC